MAEPKVSILLQAADRASQVFDRAGKGVRGFYADAKKQGAEFLASKFGTAAIIAGIGVAVKKLGDYIGEAFQTFDEFRVANQKLAGTAKITGASLDWLTGIAADAEKQFGLSKAQASDFAVEVAKLAAKAGDLGAAAPALQKFLDIGAARGLSASETLTALKQAILGIDEGTDKLFNKNPSVIYKEFADSVGLIPGKMTDTQKAQALLNAAMADGGKVTGSYAEYLDTAAGKAEQAANRSQAFKAELGALLEPVRNLWTSGKETAAEAMLYVVRALEQFGATTVAFFAGIPPLITKLFASAAEKVAEGASKIAGVIPGLGKLFQVGLDGLADWAAGAVQRADDALVLNRKTWELRSDEIWDRVKRGETKLTTATAKGAADRQQITAEQLKARQKQEEDAQAALVKLHKASGQAQLIAMDALNAQLLELRQALNAALKTTDEQAQQDAIRSYQLAVDRVLDKIIGIKPRVVEVQTQLKGLATTLSTDVTPTVETSTHTIYDFLGGVSATSSEVAGIAQDVLKFSQSIGLTNPQVEKLVGNVGQLATGLNQVSSSITAGGINVGGLMGGIAAGIVGLQGIVGSLFGDSPAEQARKQLLRENSDRLRQLKEQIGDLMRSQTTGGKIAQFQGAIGDISALASGSNDSPDRHARAARLIDILNKRGLGPSDLNSILSDIGVNLGDWMQNGLTREQAGQLAEGLRGFEPGQFDQSFSGQLDFIDTLLSTSGSQDPTERLGLIVQALQGANSGALASLVGGADLSTAEGRANLRAQLASLVSQANTPGGVDTTLFGDLTGSEFFRVIETIAGLVGQIGDTSAGSLATTTTASIVTSPAASAIATPTAGSLGLASDSTVFSDIAVATKATAANTERGAIASERIARMLEANGGIGFGNALDEALQLSRDLYNASQGTL